MLHNVRTIAKKELASYFNQPVAYIVIVSFLAVSGWMFFSTLFLLGRADMRTLFAPSPFSPAMLLVIFAPAVTMRLVAEEKKSGTFELITTLPISDADLVLGKFVAALLLLVTALAPTLLYAVSVASLGDLDWGPVCSGYLGLLLFSSALLAMGILCSALAQQQIVAFIVSFLLGATLFFVFWLQFFVPAEWAPVLEQVSLSYHLENLARGVVDSRDVVFFVSVTCGALFLAERSVARQHA